MSSCNFSSILFIAAVVIYTFAVLTLFKDDNPVRLVSDYLYDLDHLDYLLHPRLSRHSVEAIYQFGDSLSDTGNFKVENPYSSFSQSPYGVTYFHKSTGRCSDGLLMIDYLAEFLNLPFVEPYLNKDGNFMHGANFAVVGATALDTSTLQAKDIMPSFTNSSLFVQLEWFKTHLTSICSNTSECKSKLSKALFIVGEIGGNDYNFAISRGKPPSFLYQMVLEVVQAISKVVEELIGLGATQVVLPGNILMGCMPVYLAGSIPNDSIFYDETKCIKILNDFAKFHNDQLHQAIRQLQLNHPDIAIVYMDLAKGMKKILHHPTSFGHVVEGMMTTTLTQVSFVECME
ncbi:GDSL esterase/lipase At1g28600-like isoform X3 [Silene latifolia]|uniref:GDSL esterase/lipase At1g28600-like isoform X3 n=1 Tax=Silene latifolia TaxID=37657 RepID=UPI003D77161D